jgi:hypothetical protein
MVLRAIRWFAVVGASSAAFAPALWSQEALEPPAAVSVCQIDYGPESAVLISWQNAESYESVEFSLDDAGAPGIVDGTFGAARVLASPGTHVFGVRGVVGERKSAWSTGQLQLLETSPVPDPIHGLDCEVLPGGGGTLRTSWSAGSSPWVSGLLQVPGQAALVEVPAVPRRPRSSSFLHPTARRWWKGRTSPGSTSRTPRATFRPPTLRSARNASPHSGGATAHDSGEINLTDPIFELLHLFLGGIRWSCDDGCDSNDDGRVDLSDPIYTLVYLFQSGSAPPAPGPSQCGRDPTEDFLGGICSGCEGN